MRYREILAKFAPLKQGALLIQKNGKMSKAEAREDILEAIHDHEIDVKFRGIPGTLGRRVPDRSLRRELLRSLAPNLIDWADSSLMAIYEISVSRADILRLWPEPEINADTIIDLPNPLTHSGLPGRPSPKKLYEAEFDRRVETGEFARVLKIESEVLHEWCNKTHPDSNPGKPKAIANNIRAAHRKALLKKPLSAETTPQPGALN